MDLRRTAVDDVAHLPTLERRAGEAFRAFPQHAWVADDTVLEDDDHRAYVTDGLSWVAVDDRARVVGFLVASTAAGTLHIDELAVDPAAQRRGVGRRLVEHAVQQARELGLEAVTLTTFLDVPFNGPWYTRLGFERLHAPDERLATLLREEHARGLTSRCAMRRAL